MATRALSVLLCVYGLVKMFNLNTIHIRHSAMHLIFHFFLVCAFSTTCCSQVAGPRPTGVTSHAECLIDLSPQAYPVEDGYQGAESALEPGGVRRDDHPVVGVKHRRLVSSLPSRISLLRSLCHQPLYPVPEDRVHYHI